VPNSIGQTNAPCGKAGSAGELSRHAAIGNCLIDRWHYNQSWIPGDVNRNDCVIGSSRNRGSRLRAPNRQDDSKTNRRGGQAGEK